MELFNCDDNLFNCIKGCPCHDDCPDGCPCDHYQCEPVARATAMVTTTKKTRLTTATTITTTSQTVHTTVTEAQTMADLATTQMPFSQTLVGKYRQVDMWNMEAFLKAEGGGFMYQVRVNFAVSFWHFCHEQVDTLF